MPQDILARVIDALPSFFEAEADLFHYGVNERSITHKLAEHLHPRFDGWHVDCEYNRRGYNPKTLPEPEIISTDDTEGRTIFPDIIVHRRGTQRNLLVVEVKKTTNHAFGNDAWKLESLTHPHGDYRYVCGLHLVLDCDNARLADASVYVAGVRHPELSLWFKERCGV